MKQTCNGCKALQKKLFGFGYYCGLGHPVNATQEIDELPIKYKPIEECEKPKTIMKFCELRLQNSRKRQKMLVCENNNSGEGENKP